MIQNSGDETRKNVDKKYSKNIKLKNKIEQ
jgi:hypothetical protein